MPGETESGLKWWIRYVVVPLIGGGGLIAVFIALLARNPQTNSPSNISPAVSTPSPTVSTNQSPSPLSSSPQTSPNNPTASRTPTIAPTRRPTATGTPIIKDSQAEDNFKGLLRNARQAFGVGQYGPACRQFRQAASIVPGKYKGTVKWNRIDEARSAGDDFHQCAQLLGKAFEGIPTQ
jgi:hypothetical protein